MPVRTVVPLGMLLSLAAPALKAAHAQSGADPLTATRKAPPSADSLRGIEERGLRLAQYDFVAWTATDSLRARGVGLTVGDRYVVRPTSDSTWEAVFGRLSAARDTFFIAYVARQRAAAPAQLEVEVLRTPLPDTGFALRAIRAIEEATQDFGPQARPYNAAVLERPDGTLFVYLVPAQVQSGVFPVGADVRYHFSADGRRVLATRRLHNAIIEFGRAAPGQPQPVATTRSAVLDDLPEDTDVFHVLVRQPQIPEYLVSREFVYSITPDGRIRLLGRSGDILRK